MLRLVLQPSATYSTTQYRKVPQSTWQPELGQCRLAAVAIGRVPQRTRLARKPGCIGSHESPAALTAIGTARLLLDRSDHYRGLRALPRIRSLGTSALAHWQMHGSPAVCTASAVMLAYGAFECADDRRCPRLRCIPCVILHALTRHATRRVVCCTDRFQRKPRLRCLPPP